MSRSGRLLAFSIVGLSACGSTDAPFGAPCATNGECSAGLTCQENTCRGTLQAPVSVDILTTVSTDEQLSVGLYTPESVAEVGQGSGLDPSVAILTENFAPPVEYPVSLLFQGLAMGSFVVYAFVPDPATPGQIRIGRNDFNIDQGGALELSTGQPIDTVTVAIVGISVLED